MGQSDVSNLLISGADAIGGRTARIEAEALLAHMLGRSRAWLYAHGNDVVDARLAQCFCEKVAARATGQPLAYLIGEREFWSLVLKVTPDTLIPRADTEILVQQALQYLPLNAVMEIADLGTGSGAIALAIAHERPRCKVLATDASAAALRVASENATRLNLGNIEFAQGDWCAALNNRVFDLIVSNPPYIAAEDPHLNQGDLRFEPQIALVSSSDGLDAIRSIVSNAAAHLKPNGRLMIEHGCHQGSCVRALFIDQGFADVGTIQDLENRDRVTCGCWFG